MEERTPRGTTPAGQFRSPPQAPLPKSAPAQPPAPATPPPSARESSVKETIESILIAFILAFIFRAFVVEAFVIPTGSMATTLLGAHMRFKCPDCGWRFDVNFSARQSGDDLTIPSRAGPELVRETNFGQTRTRWVDKVYDARCPNCGYQLPLPERTNPEVRYGDRILVLKYLYLFQQPRRWDVVVFKSPDDPQYQQNFIKRLIGKPGESVMILDGDIYIGKGEDTSTYQIQTKPRYVQEALWRNIYDNDYYPLGLSRKDQWGLNTTEPWRQPWRASDGAGWNGPWGGKQPAEAGAAQNRNFTFDNLSGASTIAFDPNANRTYAFTDYIAYDLEEVGRAGPRYVANTVSDLKLSFFYRRTAGDGPVRLRMSKGADTFIAELTPGRAKLIRERAGQQTVIGEASIAQSGRPVEVELSNHDYQVMLRVADEDVIKTTPEQYQPSVKSLLADVEAGRPSMVPTVEIAAERQQCELSHLRLCRDIYYISKRPDGLPFAGTPGNLMHLGADEYFVLGDNSLISGDARYWSRPIELPFENLSVEPGRVPGRFMLGKAFFVYWPAGFRPFAAAPPLAPDFGDMRFIR
jgi:signal peptidase I